MGFWGLFLDYIHLIGDPSTKAGLSAPSLIPNSPGKGLKLEERSTVSLPKTTVPTHLTPTTFFGVFLTVSSEEGTTLAELIPKIGGCKNERR